MKILDWIRGIGRKGAVGDSHRNNPDPLYESEREEDRGPWSCPKCGSRIEEFSEVLFCEKSPAPIESGSSIVGRTAGQCIDTGYGDMLEIPPKAIIAIPGSGIYACLGLKNRDEVEAYLAEDFPRGKVPDIVVYKPSCGWTGLTSEYRNKWI